MDSNTYWSLVQEFDRIHAAMFPGGEEPTDEQRAAFDAAFAPCLARHGVTRDEFGYEPK